MRTPGFVFLLAYLLPQGSAPAQEVPDFTQVAGFQLPPVRAGQYVLNIQPRYQRGPMADSSWSSLIGPQGVFLTTTSTGTKYDFGATMWYGIDDRVTANVQLAYEPRQERGSSAYNSQSTASGGYPLAVGGLQRSGRTVESAFFSRGVLALRPDAGMELSLGGYFALTRRPYADASGQKQVSPFPYEPGSSSTYYPSFPDIMGYPFNETASSRVERCGMNAGMRFSSGQDISINDVQLFGFSMPSPPPGNFIASLDIAYDREPAGTSRLDQTILEYPGYGSSVYLTGSELSDASESLYGLTGLLIYGIGAEWTTSLRMYAAPDQAADHVVETIRYYGSPSLWYYTDRTVNGRLGQARISWAIAYRPVRNIELSFGAGYSYHRRSEVLESKLAFIESDEGGHYIYQQRWNVSGETVETHLDVAVLSNRKTAGSLIPVAGYRVPILSAGELSLGGGVSYSIASAREGFGMAVGADDALTSWRQPSLGFRSSFLYGLADEWTGYWSLEYSPPFAGGSRAFTYVDNFGFIVDLYNGTMRRESLSTTFTLAYRPVYGIEISVRASYVDTRLPASGSTAALGNLLNYSEASLVRDRFVNCEAGITLLKP